LYWPEQIYDFMKWRYTSKMKNRKIIIGGNTATVNPSILIGMGCEVFLGDGENWREFNDKTYIVNSETNEPKEKSVAKGITPLLYEDIQTTRRAFMELARGCANRCLFCQYSWLKPYQESDITDIKNVINKCKTKSIRAFSADRFQHSQFKHIKDIFDRKGKNDTGSDLSIRFLLKNPEMINYTLKCRTGVEGMSYRLRKMIGKNFNDDRIVEFSKIISDNGKKTMDWYMIYGLPTECENDIIEFKNLLIRLDNELPEGFVLCIHWNAFTPSAQTPLQWAACDANKLSDKMDKYLFSTRDNKRIKILHKPKRTSTTTLIKRMVAIRSNEDIQLLTSFNKQMNKILANPSQFLREWKKRKGFDLMGELPEGFIFPWDKYIKYDKDRMYRMYKKRVLNNEKA